MLLQIPMSVFWDLTNVMATPHVTTHLGVTVAAVMMDSQEMASPA